MKWNYIYSVHKQGSQNITPSHQLAKVGTKFQPNLAFQEKQKYYFQTIYSKYSIYKLTKMYTFIPIHRPYHIIAEGELPPLTYA